MCYTRVPVFEGNGAHRGYQGDSRKFPEADWTKPIIVVVFQITRRIVVKLLRAQRLDLLCRLFRVDQQLEHHKRSRVLEQVLKADEPHALAAQHLKGAVVHVDRFVSRWETIEPFDLLVLLLYEIQRRAFQLTGRSY